MPDATHEDQLHAVTGSADASRGVMGIEEFTALASKLANLGLYREAINLYETATRLYPENIALKINLARVRDMKRRADRETLRDLDASIQARRIREDMLANQYVGLGYLYYRRGDIERAREYFEFARTRNDSLYLPPLYLAKIAIGRNDVSGAITCLEQARHANPFSEEALSLLGRLYMERGDNEQALTAFVDALVLSGDTELSKQPFYHDKLKEISGRLGKDLRTDLPPIVRQRTARFTSLAEKLERGRREALRERASQRLHTVFAAFSAQSRSKPTDELEDVTALHRYAVFEKLDDTDLSLVAGHLERKQFEPDQLVFSEGEQTNCLFFIDRGRVRVRKMTPFGEHVLTTLGEGEVFGEMNFLDGRAHSADAVAEEPLSLFTLPKHEAEVVFTEARHIAVHMMAYFWRTLAQHIRDTNEQMKSFFVSEAINAEKSLDHKRQAEAEKVIVDINKKIALFKEKGLSGKDLEVLASLSTEERYNREDLIFREGDEGSKLYIVLDGRVRISKLIPGVGEEALAVLERGDFFGEMALIDNKPRSADARAHEDRSTVIAIDKSVLEDILSADVETAQQFLSIMCRILSQRLREINETIVKWRIMAGGF
jgi:CRP-like cAMP-binding protein